MIACAEAIYERNKTAFDSRIKDEYGRAGELAALKESVRAALIMPWLEILHNRIVGEGPDSIEADLIICGHSNIYVFEVKCLAGLLSSSRRGKWLQGDIDGTVKSISNGFRQARRVKKILACYLSKRSGASERSLKKRIITKVIFTGKKLDLSRLEHNRRDFLMLNELAGFLWTSESRFSEVSLPEIVWRHLNGLEKMSVIKLNDGRQYQGRIVFQKRLAGFGRRPYEEFVIFEPRGRNMVVIKSSEINKISS